MKKLRYTGSTCNCSSCNTSSEDTSSAVGRPQEEKQHELKENLDQDEEDMIHHCAFCGRRSDEEDCPPLFSLEGCGGEYDTACVDYFCVPCICYMYHSRVFTCRFCGDDIEAFLTDAHDTFVGEDLCFIHCLQQGSYMYDHAHEDSDEGESDESASQGVFYEDPEDMEDVNQPLLEHSSEVNEAPGVATFGADLDLESESSFPR